MINMSADIYSYTCTCSFLSRIFSHQNSTHTMTELLESLDAIDSWVIVSHPSSCHSTELLKCNSKFPCFISLVIWFYSVYMDQCGFGYICRLENTEVLQRRNWSTSTGNWSLAGAIALMTSTSFTLLHRIACLRGIFVLLYNNFVLPNRGKKREKKSKHKSRKSSNEALNT